MWNILVCMTLFPILLANYLKIVNGKDAREGEFPFVVSLRNQNRHICGGTILNKDYILTAAHCVCKSNDTEHDPKSFSIQYDSIKISDDTSKIVNVGKIVCSRDIARSLTGDWAVLKLEKALPEGNWKPVKLSKTLDTSKEQHGTIVGWGRTSPDGALAEKLQKLDVTLYSDEQCGKKYDITHHICFGSDDGGACSGDSGTALLVDGVQVGIASFITDVCGIANPEHPNVYARIESYYESIKQIAGIQ